MNLAFVSLFVQRVCLLRGILGRLTDVCTGAASFFLVLVVTGLATEIGFRVVQGRWMELELSGPEITHYWFGQGAATAHLKVLLGNLVISGIVTAIALRYFYIQHHCACSSSESRWREFKRCNREYTGTFCSIA